MCCDADWKREVVQDYKWDYVDVRDFRKTDFLTRFKYTLVYACILRDLAIIGLDVFTCVTMLSSSDWKTAVFARCKQVNPDGTVRDNCNMVQFNAARWVFVGCIFFSFLLYGYEFYRARKVVLSGDISYSYTNIMANDYYSVKDYNNFCLFCKLGSSKKKKDTLTFFVFFTFKNWKRVLLADGPRQCINGIMLYLVAKTFDFNFNYQELHHYWDDSISTLLLLLAMLTTIALFLISFIQIVIASFFYVPLLFYIQGNLKEYVCHKVDKRMGDIMRRNQKQRFNRAVEFEKKLANGETITNSRGEELDAALLQPTLPVIILDDDKVTYGSNNYMRPRSPAHGHPMQPVMMRPVSPAPPIARQQPPPGWGKPQQRAPPPVTEEVTEMDIYDAYGDDDNSLDGHSSYHGHGGSSYHGHGGGHSFPTRRDHDGSKVSLLGSAAPMGEVGHSYPPQARAGAPSYPPGASIAPPHRTAGAPPAPIARAGTPGGPPAPRGGPGMPLAPYGNRPEWSAPLNAPHAPARYVNHGW